jgi:hypothetical protein
MHSAPRAEEKINAFRHPDGAAPPISDFQKFRLTPGANQHYSDLVPSHRGALRNVINAGRDAMDVGSARDERGLLAYGQVVWF